MTLKEKLNWVSEFISMTKSILYFFIISFLTIGFSYAQKNENRNPKKMIITPVQLDINNNTIQRRLDKIALGIFLR